MEKAGSIDSPAWIVNDTCASIRVNDLDISLELNSPYDLSNISAKRIDASSELKSLIRQDIVKFINPEDTGLYLEQAAMGAENYGSLEVYSSPDEAEAAIGKVAVDGGHAVINEASAMNLTESELDGPTEEEIMINLTNIPAIKDPAVDGVRVTSHGQVSPPQNTKESSAPKIKLLE